MEKNWHVATVVKVPKDCRLKIFSDDFFRQKLAQERLKGYDKTSHLTRLTAIRTSFVKGWGMGYRRSVSFIVND